MYYNNIYGINISALGMGCMRFPMVEGTKDRIDREKAQKIVDKAIESGINYFDTAHIYQNGDSESFLGEALSKYKRDSYYLTSKFYAGNDIEATFESQLERCKTDYFDFYLLHDLDEAKFGAYTDKEKNYIGYLKKQKELGRIRHIGFSSHASPELLRRFLDMNENVFDMALIQLNYIDYTMLSAKEQYDILTERGIPVFVMEPMKGGRLSTLNENASALLKSEAPDRSVSSWGFRFIMSLPNVCTVLSGMSSLDQVEDNVRTFSSYDPLSEREGDVLKNAVNLFISDLGVPCSECRYCCPVCPMELDIPVLIKSYNERSMTGDSWRIHNLKSAGDPSTCISCGSCAERCPQKIDIPAIMKKLATK